MFLLGKLHHEIVFQRRVRALVSALSPLLEDGDVLDVGSGNGMLSHLIMQQRPDVKISGLDVHLREESYIPTVRYDGHKIPYADGTFSSVMLVDVLHHTDDPVHMLRECLRVSRKVVVIKDHFYSNIFEHQILRFLDWVGNAPHGVRLPYNYFTRAEWASYLHTSECYEVQLMNSVPHMYPPFFQQIIGQNPVRRTAWETLMTQEVEFIILIPYLKGLQSLNTQIKIVDRSQIPIVRCIAAVAHFPFGQSIMAIGRTKPL